MFSDEQQTYPNRVVVGANGAYWRDFGTHYSMCPVSTDNDPVEPVAVYIRADVTERIVVAAVKTALGMQRAVRGDARYEGMNA